MPGNLSAYQTGRSQSPITAPRFIAAYQKNMAQAGGARPRPAGVPPPPSPEPAVARIMTDARVVLGDIQQILGILYNQNGPDSPEYQQVQALARQLSDDMRATRAAATQGIKQV